MPIGVRDMGFNTATNLFPLNGMPKFPLPPNPKAGCLMFDDQRAVWVAFNGKEWIDIYLNEYITKSSLERVIYGKDLDEKSVQE